MFTFTFNKEPLKLGDYDQKYGQSWWAEVNEDLKPVKFNTMSQNLVLKAGDTITCEESLNKRSTKGKDYLQLKKVQPVPNGAETPLQRPVVGQTGNLAVDYLPGQSLETRPGLQTSSSSGLHEQLDRIEAKLDQLLGQDERLMGEVEPVKVAGGWEAARQKLNQAPAIQTTTEFGDEDSPDYE